MPSRLWKVDALKVLATFWGGGHIALFISNGFHTDAEAMGLQQQLRDSILSFVVTGHLAFETICFISGYLASRKHFHSASRLHLFSWQDLLKACVERVYRIHVPCVITLLVYGLASVTTGWVIWPHGVHCTEMWRLLFLIPTTPRIRPFCLPLVFPFHILLWCHLCTLVGLYCLTHVMKLLALVPEQTRRHLPKFLHQSLSDPNYKKKLSKWVLMTITFVIFCSICRMISVPAKRLLYEETLSPKLITEHYFQRYTVRWSCGFSAFLAGYGSHLIDVKKTNQSSFLQNSFAILSLVIFSLVDVQRLIYIAEYVHIPSTLAMVLQKITFIGVLVLISRQARQDEDFLSTESRGILAKTTSGFFLALIAPWPFLMSLLSYVLSIGMRVTVLRLLFIYIVSIILTWHLMSLSLVRRVIALFETQILYIGLPETISCNRFEGRVIPKGRFDQCIEKLRFKLTGNRTKDQNPVWKQYVSTYEQEYFETEEITSSESDSDVETQIVELSHLIRKCRSKVMSTSNHEDVENILRDCVDRCDDYTTADISVLVAILDDWAEKHNVLDVQRLRMILNNIIHAADSEEV